MNPLAAEENAIWAFDLGKASIGEAVRNAQQFLHAASHLIPAELAQRGPATSPGTPASLYRAMKTREAHRAREDRLREICAEASLEVLDSKRVARNTTTKLWELERNADPRLTREFPPRNGPDKDTCFTSCLLRIKLLQGEQLEPWQVFKALHSAIQRRGYDSKPAWISSQTVERHEKNDEDMVTAQRMNAYRDVLEQMAPGADKFHYPCYLDAYRMGLWNPGQPHAVKLRIDHHTEPARNRGDEGAIVAPRERVIAECRALLEAAAKQFPKLAGRADEIIFGRGGVPYASHDPKLRQQLGLRQGGAGDWAGVLGQKVPRFDNRIIAKCALIPRLNVCKAEVRHDANKNPIAESLLPSEVTFLLKLKNARVERGTGESGGLSAGEINRIFTDPARAPEKLSFTETQWKKLCAKFEARPATGHELIAEPRSGGRSRLSRPALRILKDLILSGRTPPEQHTRELAKLNGNTEPHRGLVEGDLDFLKRMGATWDGIHVPDQQHDTLLVMREREGREAAIRKLIGGVNDPIVRHRLETFWRRVQALEEKFGKPGQVAIEFVRTDFMGDKAKRELALFQKKRETARKEARANAKEVNAASRSASTKLELLKEQGGICLYTGAGLAPTSVEDLEIEHIVPRSQGGPDAMLNYVVTTKTTNDAKDNRTPYQWFAAQGFAGWVAYLQRVNERATSLRTKKVKLLTSPEAAELVDRYTALAETAWIAKLSQTLVALHFGWPIRSELGERRITIVNGGLTARIRRRYRLNSLLNPCPEGTDPLDWEEQCEKNRDDDRHHALDAMVISFVPSWARDPKKAGFFRMPDNVSRETFAETLAKVFASPLAYKKPALAATAYAMRRGEKGAPIIVQRLSLADLAQKPAGAPGKTVFDLGYLRKQAVRIRDPRAHRIVADFAAQEIDEAVWAEFCKQVTLPRKDGSPGSRIKKVSVFVGDPTEYKDLSKDRTGSYRKALKEHRGQFVFRNLAGKAGACPVYAFEAIHQVHQRLATEGLTPLMFLQSGCLVQTSMPAAHEKQPLPAGTYQINSVRANTNAALHITKTSYVQLTAQDGTTYVAKPKPGQRSLPLYSLEALLAAGLKPAN
ncbi:MAG: HNH endonuclease domain-containing protein [Candidatus Didemnitutus sp.]|nr:HNH endonuclease domain-containing protein [Candidatus Didemnitutus sp.]